MIGPSQAHETVVNGLPAWWYSGTWNASGEWVQAQVISLIWEQAGFVYQLTGQELELAELVRIAESIE